MYTAGIWFRNALYDKGIFRVRPVGVPVISVGNLTAGGTGKTPVVEYLLRYLLKHGKKVAVISRGYKRSTSGTFIVSDGRQIFGTAKVSGDEPYQMARKFPSTVVIVDEVRGRAARVAVNIHRADVIVLDDAFQHRSIARDLDIVMIDGQTILKEIPMLPAGIRREPLSALRRADILVVSRSGDLNFQKEGFKQYSTAPIAKVEFKPKSLVHWSTLKSISCSDIKGQSCIAFCGIGNPMSFHNILKSIGFTVIEFIRFPDHHRYSSPNLKTIEEKFRSSNAQMIVTTEKDAVRLSPDETGIFSFTKSLYYLEIEAEIVEGELVFHQMIDATLHSVR